MFEKNEHSVTIIGEGVKLEGDFSGQGDLELYGEIRGNVAISGFIKIGRGSTINANVSAERAEIAGYIKGKLVVKKDVDLLASAEVHGDIKTHQITVAKGARISGKIITDGKSETTEKSAPNKKEPSD